MKKMVVLSNMRRAWIVAAGAVLLLVALWYLATPADDKPTVKSTIDWQPVVVAEELDDWTDILELPYDQAVGRLRSKYGETFPVMVLREGATSTAPVDKSTFYMWVDARGIVTEYTYEEEEDTLLSHGGIVRQYDGVVPE